MKRQSYPKALDEALRPFGFERHGDDWIRVRGDMWECVNRQSSWLGGVTINFDMKDLDRRARSDPDSDHRREDGRTDRWLRSMVEEGRAERSR